jgi:putative oxidoreductase
MDLAFLVIRIVFGLALAAHGAQKLLGWFGGPGLAGASGLFETLGFRPGRFFAVAASLGEICGGLLTAAGLFGAFGPAVAIMVMLVAALTVHLRNGFFSQGGGVELTTLYILTALAIAFAGNGAFSLDRAFGLTALTNPVHVSVALAVALVLALLNVAARRPAAAPAT